MSELSQHLKSRIMADNERAIRLSGKAINPALPCFIGSETHADHLVYTIRAVLQCFGPKEIDQFLKEDL